MSQFLLFMFISCFRNKGLHLHKHLKSTTQIHQEDMKLIELWRKIALVFLDFSCLSEVQMYLLGAHPKTLSFLPLSWTTLNFKWTLENNTLAHAKIQEGRDGLATAYLTWSGSMPHSKVLAAVILCWCGLRLIPLEPLKREEPQFFTLGSFLSMSNTEVQEVR